ncbi:MAG TPA: hypothetical protein VHK06_04845 [Candidatus Limnocylindria bacterium]|nr:hypothetical protein [Candidatus Limnocylindria bacterium]
MTRRTRTRLGASALVAAMSLTATLPVLAADGARLGLTPVGQDGTYFELTLEPGETRGLEVEAANFGDADVLARTYAADVYTIVNGGFGADLFGEEPTGTTTWLSYPTEEMTLGRRDAQIISFEVRVPDGTPPGEYVAALVIENVEPIRGSGSVAVDQVNRSAIAVAIDVPGPRRPALRMGAVGHHVAGERSVVTFEIENPGNVHLKPAGSFRLLDPGRSELSSAELAMDSVYAGTSTVLEAPLADLLPAGDYCAELRLSDPETGVTAAIECRPFSVTPPAADPGDRGSGSRNLPLRLPSTDALLAAAPVSLLVALGFGLLAAALILAARRRRRERDRGRRAPPAAGHDRIGS